MFFFFNCLGETDLIKKGEGIDIGLLSGTHVMEGSGRMVIVGVGLNSQVGTIMSLLGATAEGNKGKKKEKNKNDKTRTQSASKVTPDLSKQNVQSEDETKPTTTTADGENLHLKTSPLKQHSNDNYDNKIKETNVDQKDEPTKNGKGAIAQAAVDDNEDEEGGASDAKHKCKYFSKHKKSNIQIIRLFFSAVLQAKLTTLALYIGYIGKIFIF